MEGYFNFGFSNSVRKPSSWFSGQRKSESNYKIEVEWNCDNVERTDSLGDGDTVDTDLDSDSFLSDLEKDSGEQTYRRSENSHRGEPQTRHYSENDWNNALQMESDAKESEYNVYNVNPVENPVLSSQRISSSSQRSTDNNNDTVPREENKTEDETKSSLDSLQSSCCYLSRLDFSCLLGIIALSVLIFALIAPHWLVTTTNQEKSSFLRLNPWDLCVRDKVVMTPSRNVTLHGCYSVWDPQLVSDNIRMVQDWFITVPASLLIAASLSLSARAFLFLIWFKKRQIVPLRLGMRLMFLCATFDLLAGLCLVTCTMVFAASVLGSGWLTPSLASLSWGWACCLASSWAHLATAVMMVREAFRERARRAAGETFLRSLGLEPGTVRA